MKLRTYFVLLTLGTLLPVVVFGIIAAESLVDRERDALQRGMQERTHAMLTAVDAKLRGSIAAAETLAAASTLTDNNLGAFRKVASDVLAGQPDWLNINLARPDGQQVLNLRVPEGGPLPNIASLDGSFERVIEGRRAVVSDLAIGQVVTQWSFAVRVPVMRNGTLRYVLSAGVNPDSISSLLVAQNIDAGAVAIVVDRNHRFVARSWEPQKYLGQLASPSVREALERSSHGWIRGRTVEGVDVYTPYSRSDVTGWAVAMGVPASSFDAGAQRAVWLVAAWLAGAVALAFLVAFLISRHIAQPIVSLATATAALGRGEPAQVPQTEGAAEITQLENALRGGVTAIREREERLRLALEAGHMGNWQWDVATDTVSWSHELEAIHGIPAGSFPGTFEAYLKDVHPDDMARVQEAIGRSLEHGPEHHIEYRIIRPDGAVRWVEGRGKVYRDKEGMPVRVIGVCTDITGRRQIEAHKDEFLAMLGHELRNPLAALTTAAHVLRVSEPREPGAMQAREVVDRQTRHMARLVEDLIDVSRITLGKVVLEREALDLGQAVAGTVDGWRTAGRLAGRARLEVDASPAWINADRIRVEQIFGNLLDNALKFTPAGGSIDISVREEGGEAVLRIRDTGRGIAPQVLGRMFEPFVQGDQQLDRNPGGMGLGLALVKRLVELHGGTVTASSEGPGKGAAFTLRFPAVPAATARSAAPESGIGGPRRVLVIEDNKDTRDMLRTALARSGHLVSEAADGAAGLAAASETQPDVAVIDIGLPDIDGYEVARRLRRGERNERIGLIALTGYGQPEDRRRALEAGFDTHLTKPVTPEHLQQAIAALS